MTRHPVSLPPQIGDPGFYVDFSRYTLATGDLKTNPDFLPDIGRIVQCIVAHYHFLKCSIPPWHDCSRFVLPPVPPPHFPR